jgi:site-specific DNA recombinase
MLTKANGETTMNGVSLNGQKRAVIYARVSTDEQAEKGYSLPSQINQCRDYAHHNGFVVVAECADDYTGTIPLEQRPEGKNAYAMLEQGEADILIVFSIDRLVRPPEEGDEWNMPVLIRGLARLGREIHTVARGKLGVSFADLLIAMLDAKTAGEERRKIIERTTRGRDAKARSGKVVGIGKAPYGYRYAKVDSLSITNLEIYEPEAQIVRFIFRLYSEGENGSHVSLDNIAAQLTAMGLPTPVEVAGHKRKRVLPPHTWTNATVYWIIKNETYAGVWRYGKFIGSGGHEGKRPTYDTIPIDVPAIVTRAVWQSAQLRGAANRHGSRNSQRYYLLTGMLYCGCEERIHGTNGRYVCASWSKHNQTRPRTCRESSIQAEALETFVWQYIHQLLTEPGILQKKLREARDGMASLIQPRLNDLQIIDDLLAELQDEATSIARALIETKDKAVVTNVLQSKAAEIDQRFAQLTARRETLLSEMQQEQISDRDIDSMVEFSYDVVRGLADPTPQQRRHWLELLRMKITIANKVVTIKCAIGTHSGTIKHSEQFKAQTMPEVIAAGPRI